MNRKQNELKTEPFVKKRNQRKTNLMILQTKKNKHQSNQIQMLTVMVGDNTPKESPTLLYHHPVHPAKSLHNPNLPPIHKPKNPKNKPNQKPQKKLKPKKKTTQKIQKIHI